MNEFADTINDYGRAVDCALKSLSQKSKSSAVTKLMKALLIRDQIAGEVKTQPITDVETLVLLARQDEKLKRAARKFTNKIGGTVLQNWRETAKREDDAWWWSLDKRAAAEKSWRDLLSKLSAWLLIALSVSFSLEIVRRYLNGGADFTSTVLQGIFALIAGSTIFRGARQFVESDSQPVAGYGILSTHKSRWAVTILLLAIAVALVGTRKLAAGKYNDQGVEEYENKRLTLAIEKYQHSISLDPTIAETHFNLGNAYEDALQYDKAINEYTEAILADQDFYLPYNNLARLYILQRKDYVDALKLADKALTLNINPLEVDPDKVQYALYKNRAWANFGLKNYRQAQKDLAQALVKRHEGISVHCLLAQTLEAAANKEGALAEWKMCSDLADQQKRDMTSKQQYYIDEPEIDWLETARERLGGTSK
jgi:tetratricopeptide (TPR) repeat protein